MWCWSGWCVRWWCVRWWCEWKEFFFHNPNLYYINFVVILQIFFTTITMGITSEVLFESLEPVSNYELKEGMARQNLYPQNPLPPPYHRLPLIVELIQMFVITSKSKWCNVTSVTCLRNLTHFFDGLLCFVSDKLHTTRRIFHILVVSSVVFGVWMNVAQMVNYYIKFLVSSVGDW